MDSSLSFHLRLSDKEWFCGGSLLPNTVLNFQHWGLCLWVVRIWGHAWIGEWSRTYSQLVWCSHLTIGHWVFESERTDLHTHQHSQPLAQTGWNKNIDCRLNTKSKIDHCGYSLIQVVGITETWLDESVTDAEAEIHGYLILHREGGGVRVYIRSDIAFNARNDIGTDLETIISHHMDWRIYVYMHKTKPILVGVCCRPPKQLDFFSLLENTCMTCQNFQIQNVYCWVTLIQIINKLTPKQTNLQYL